MSSGIRQGLFVEGTLADSGMTGRGDCEAKTLQTVVAIIAIMPIGGLEGDFCDYCVGLPKGVLEINSLSVSSPQTPLERGAQKSQ